MADAPYLSLVQPWDREKARELTKTRIFTLKQHHARSRTQPDKEGSFVYLETGDWVNVVALTDDDQVIMVEQYRHGVNEVTLEIPGGMVDEGESALQAGLRELTEETGFGGDAPQIIGRVSPNPAIMTNWCHTILVEGVSLRGAPSPDGTEEVGVRLVALADIPELIRSGVIHHALVVAAFQHLAIHSASS
jgi:8-oxo-dGTP pyrophosphatase MutT (NUDIX family)